MKGFVPTPPAIVDVMIGKLFRDKPPKADATLLDPGCGNGAFIDGVIRWCSTRKVPLPEIIGVELNPRHVHDLRARFANNNRVEIRKTDFLARSEERYDYVVGNPPYVAITALSEKEREAYRRTFITAKGRFDLYLLFFEQAVQLLKTNGRLVFITPEKFVYVETAEPLRDVLSKVHVEELHFVGEETFGGLVTYPLITTVSRSQRGDTRVIHRDGSTDTVQLNGSRSWQPVVRGAIHDEEELTLEDVCIRVSCGVATGADSIYILRDADIGPELREFAHPSIAGRQLRQGEPPRHTHSLLAPYDADGRLLPDVKLGHLREYLSEPGRRAQLLARTCVRRKPWYAFHETPPFPEILRPKLLCKDIGSEPFFVVDREGGFVPRHSVYYIIPKNPEHLEALAEYLNSPTAHQWLRAHCQRASKGFIRLQSHTLKRLPVPSEFAALDMAV